MTFEDAQKEFAVRFYHWSMEQARAEVEQGFPLLNRIDDSYCRKHLRRMAKLSVQDQHDFTALLIRRSHPQAAGLLGEGLTDEEVAKIHGYFDEFLMEVDPQRDDYYTKLHQRDPSAKLDKRRFRKIIRETLPPALGKPDSGSNIADWTYTNSIEGLGIETYVDTGGRHHHLKYHHDIRFSDCEYLRRWISVDSWLGLGGRWSQVVDTKAEEAANLLAELCERFLKAAPDLLRGLAP